MDFRSLIEGFFDRMQYKCPSCGKLMHFADEEVLVCDNCGYGVDADDYPGERYEDIYYAKKEEICGYTDDEEDESGEWYDPEWDE